MSFILISFDNESSKKKGSHSVAALRKGVEDVVLATLNTASTAAKVVQTARVKIVSDYAVSDLMSNALRKVKANSHYVMTDQNTFH